MDCLLSSPPQRFYPVILIPAGFYSTFEPDRITEPCPEKCRRTVTKSIRKCGLNRKYFNTTSEEICTSDDVMKVICLDREGCSETGIYLANYGQSCGQFCSTKSNFIFFTLQLSYFFLTKSKSFSKAISDMACDLESYALER